MIETGPDNEDLDQERSVPSTIKGTSIDPMIQGTILNESEIDVREKNFADVWLERFKPRPGKEGYFQSEEVESPFSEFSSRGWKIHIAFQKGQEKLFAKLLYTHGLYFKVEAGIGTYFQGKKESGATIYIGSYDNMMKVAELIRAHLGGFLQDGVVATAHDKKIRLGSGTDIEIMPRVMARFDIANTELGTGGKTQKYMEAGLPSWLGLGGLPVLKKYGKETSEAIDSWPKMTPEQRKLAFYTKLKPAYDYSRKELIKDFGEDFLLGKTEE